MFYLETDNCKNMVRKTILLAFLLPLLAFAQKSPNGRIHVETTSDSLNVFYENLKLYSVSMDGIGTAQMRRVKDSYEMRSGKRLHCHNSCVEAVYSLRDGGVLLVRAYNDGVAFRKVGCESTGSESEFPFTIDFSAAKNNWMMKWSEAYEGFYPKNAAKKDGERMSYPALFEYSLKHGGRVFVLLTEADIHADNAAASLYATSSEGVYRVAPDNNPQKADASAWTTCIIGELSDVVESTLVTDLSCPNKIGDDSWVKPGVASWVYWAYNHGSNDMNIIRRYVELAVSLKLPYVLIDAEWDEMKDGYSIEDAVKYAVDRGIKPIIWYSSSIGWLDGAPGPKFRLNKTEDREKEFEWCQKIGVAGIKVDFFSGDNNRNMAFMIDILESAARHKLLVNFHGATLPRGWQRTYPNLISTEAVYGAEWYNNVPTFTKRAAAHNAILPFTRNVVGSMDYTPCAFSDSQHPHITTHAHELALTALFESGIQHLADRPESFLAQPAEVRNYLSNLPAAWDETILLAGYPAESVVMARRKGDVWYVAGINGLDQKQTLSFSTKRLKSLGKNIQVFEDSGDALAPWRISSPSKMPCSFNCAPRGGFLIVIKK